MTDPREDFNTDRNPELDPEEGVVIDSPADEDDGDDPEPDDEE